MSKILDDCIWSMQVEIPESMYGKVEWSVPREMNEWFKTKKLNICYAGSHLSGTGYVDGVSTRYYVYRIDRIEQEDGVIFKLLFPKCKVRVMEIWDGIILKSFR